MSSIYNCAPISEALIKLKKNGFTYDFNLNLEDIIIHPENYIIKEIYQYEGNSDVINTSTVYGIENKFGLKGFIVTDSTANSDAKNKAIIAKLNIKNVKEPYM